MTTWLLWKLWTFYLQIVLKFTTNLIYSQVYKISVSVLLWLLYSISIHACYYFELLSQNLLKWPPKTNQDFENDPPARWLPPPNS